MNESVKAYMTVEAVQQIRDQLIQEYGPDFLLDVVGAKRFPEMAKFLLVIRATGDQKEPADIDFDVARMVLSAACMD
jgi:hypothetical protein